MLPALPALMKHTPVKILHVLHTLGAGGMENGVVNLARRLPPAEFETHVCCLESSGPFAQRLPCPQHISVLDKPPGFSWRTAWRLRRLLHRLQPEVIHTHSLGTLIYAGLATTFSRHGAIVHGEHILLPPEECQPRRLRQRRWFYRQVRAAHSVSEGVRQQLIGHGFSAEKILPLLNGVDCGHFKPGDRMAARRQIGGLPEDALVLGIVGRFAPQKGHARLIEVFAELCTTRSDLHLLIIGGGGSEEDNSRAQARASQAAARIHFTGFQNNLPPYYQSLDLLIAPSTLEGLSNAVLEAMACGVPVLAHPACGNSEMISAGLDGFIAELDTPAKLRRELDLVLAQAELLPAKGLAARAKVERQFSLDAMTEQYINLYRDVATSRRN